MNLKIRIVSNIYPKPEAGAPMPSVYADDSQLILTYITPNDDHAIVQFPLVHVFQFGSPNDEALHGHPLFKLGLKYYEVHDVENSNWIAELEKQNSVHMNHNKEHFLKDKKHLIFTFHDSTFECVATINEDSKPKIQTTRNKSDLLEILKKTGFL